MLCDPSGCVDVDMGDHDMMWHDVETTTDLLNLTVVADTAAQLVREFDGQPCLIGVSGNWGTGKSSLVKMIEISLKNADAEGGN